MIHLYTIGCTIPIVNLMQKCTREKKTNTTKIQSISIYFHKCYKSSAHFIE